ncbi:MAG: 3'-5' exonuclease [Bacteroidia bacterium]|nr:3'-5' exonuclease [Bacteroidia bacterium]
MKNILFLDIETVPQHESYQLLNDRWKKLWDIKANQIAKNEETPEELYSRAGIYAEFGKIICISVGFIHDDGNGREFRIKSFYGESELIVLEEFCALLQHNYNPKSHFLCAHNGKEFDFPYLSRRILINGIKMPDMLDLAGKKPWDVKHLDTMNLWKFGDFKNYTSLDLLSAVFDLPSSKDDIDGSKIFDVYYMENDLERIRAYCQNDVAALASIYLHMVNQPPLKPDEIKLV